MYFFPHPPQHPPLLKKVKVFLEFSDLDQSFPLDFVVDLCHTKGFTIKNNDI
jgi:hypothetical protein